MIVIGPQAEGEMIPKAVAMKAIATDPIVEQVKTTASEPRVETQVDPLPGSSTKVVIHETMIEDAMPLHSMQMSEIRTSSRGRIELFDDKLIDPASVSINMESWRHMEQWVKVCYEYPE